MNDREMELQLLKIATVAAVVSAMSSVLMFVLELVKFLLEH